MRKVAANMPEKIRRLFREAGVQVPETAKSSREELEAPAV